MTQWKEEAKNTEIKARYFNCEKNKYKRFCERLSSRANDIEIIYQNSGVEAALKIIISEISGDNEKDRIDGLGAVYILTILYFITQCCDPFIFEWVNYSFKLIAKDFDEID